MSKRCGLVRSVLTGIAIVALVALGRSKGAEAQQLKYAGARGCGDVVVYGWTEDHTEAIIVRADRARLGLHAGDNTVTIAPDRKGLDVLLELYGRPQRDLPAYHCNDVRLQEWDRPASTLAAASGTLLITLAEPGAVEAPIGGPSAYEATVSLRDVVFRRPDGTKASVTTPITLKAFVGFFYG